MNRYVVNKVLQPMETTDPFADDFYFLQVLYRSSVLPLLTNDVLYTVGIARALRLTIFTVHP